MRALHLAPPGSKLSRPHRLHGGSGHRLCLPAARIGLRSRLKECGIARGETRTRAFLAKNPNGRAAIRLVQDCIAQSHGVIGDGPTIADIALYAYTRVADQGGIGFASHAHGRTRRERRAAPPGYNLMRTLPHAAR